jgi:CheY-like chemotaxis protein
MRLEPFETGRRHVLYVEDHAINALLMAAYFEHRPSLELVVAPTGGDALALAADLQPAVLLLDLNLPDCDGFGLLKQLRGVPGCEQAPAVLVTADVMADIDGSEFCELWTCRPCSPQWTGLPAAPS